MPRYFTYIVLVGVIVAIAGVVTVLRSNSPSASSESRVAATPAKPFGNTAISHGGPAPTPTEVQPAAMGAGQIGLGQTVVLNASLPLLLSVPQGESSGSSVSASPDVAAGTMATVISIAPAVPPDTRQSETYYKIELSDGRTGWVPERGLRAAPAPAREPSSR